MPDVWELQYSSILNPEFAGDKWQDSDGDGVINLEEFAFAGDPNDSPSGYQGNYSFTNDDGLLSVHIK